jgi:hypothetical protein
LETGQSGYPHSGGWATIQGTYFTDQLGTSVSIAAGA